MDGVCHHADHVCTCIEDEMSIHIFMWIAKWRFQLIKHMEENAKWKKGYGYENRLLSKY